jgi:urease accessory protein
MVTTMTTDGDALYRLMSWLSPSFPVGAFSYSHGIENAVEARLVTNEAGLRDWIDSGLKHEFGPVNGAMLRAAYDTHDLAQALEEARALVPTLEFELEHKSQGEAFMLAFRAAWGEVQLPTGWVPYPSAVGIAARTCGVPLRAVLIAFFHSVVSNLISAGIRTVPLGQTAGQRILSSLQSAVIAATDDALARDHNDVGSAAPMIEWTSIRHETQYTRLFRS